MVKKVTIEEIMVDYPGFGKIIIPQWTPVVYDKNLPEEERTFHISTRDWIDDKYPDAATELCESIKQNRILIPADKLHYILKVKYNSSDVGNCRDLFMTEKEILICRMETYGNYAAWYTITPDWEEPDCPLRTDLWIQILDAENNIVVREQQDKVDGDFRTVMKFPFSYMQPKDDEESEVYKKIYGVE